MTKERVAEYFVVQTEDSRLKLKRPKPKQWLLMAGISLVLMGIICLISWPLVYQALKDFGVSMRPDSYKFKKWKDDFVPIKMSVYFFNWTNPEEVTDLNTKPIFVELGPYVFQERRLKVNITWNQNGTITFKQRRIWHFDEANSPNKLTDEVTTINAIALSAAYKVNTFGFMASKGLSTAFQTLRTTIHSVKTVGELMFDGYEDQILTIGRNVPFLPKDAVPDMKKFCWFHNRNGTTFFDGTINMGTEFPELLGEVKRVNYDSRLPYNSGPCGEVRGSFGDIYPANLDKSDLEVYTSELCRSVPVEFAGLGQALGFKSYKYILGSKFLDNGTLYPENKCYHEGKDVPSGVYNVSLCRHGTPSFISLPHFYGADPFYLNAIKGLNPEKEKHEFYLQLEPETGTPLEAKGRVQVNLMLQKINNINLFKNVPTVLMPVLWMEQDVILPRSEIWKLNLLLKFPTISIIMGSILITLGLLTFLHLVAIKRRSQRKNSNRKCNKSILR